MNSQPVSRRARAALALSLVLPTALALSACNPVSPDKIASPTPSGSHLAAAHEASTAPSASASPPTATRNLEGWTWGDGKPVVASVAPETGTSCTVTLPTEALPRGTEERVDWTGNPSSSGARVGITTFGNFGDKATPALRLVTTDGKRLLSPFAPGTDPFDGNEKALPTSGEWLWDAMEGKETADIAQRIWPLQLSLSPRGDFAFIASDGVPDTGSGQSNGGYSVWYATKIGAKPVKLADVKIPRGSYAVPSGLDTVLAADGSVSVGWQGEDSEGERRAFAVPSTGGAVATSTPPSAEPLPGTNGSYAITTGASTLELTATPTGGKASVAARFATSAAGDEHSAPVLMDVRDGLAIFVGERYAIDLTNKTAVTLRETDPDAPAAEGETDQPEANLSPAELLLLGVRDERTLCVTGLPESSSIAGATRLGDGSVQVTYTGGAGAQGEVGPYLSATFPAA